MRGKLVLALVTGLAIGAVTMTPAFGGGLFTKHKAKNLFYTKAASDARFLTPGTADGRYLTPGTADGRYLTPGTGDGRYLRQGGVTQIQIGTDSFEPSSPGVIFRPVTGVQLAANATNTARFNAPLTIPSVIESEPTGIDSVEFCYSASPTATIDSVAVERTTALNGPGTISNVISDDTDRSDAACRTYAAASPVAIGPDDMLTFVVVGKFTGSPNLITVHRLTVNLSGQGNLAN
jgi:hypothetical protein